MTTVRLIAPSGYPNDSAIAERGVAFLQGQGCAVVNQACLARQHQRFAGGEWRGWPICTRSAPAAARRSPWPSAAATG